VRASGSIGTLLAIGLLVVLGGSFAMLGRWQWQRAAESRAAAEDFAAAGAADSLAAAPPDLAAGALRFRGLEIDGAYVPGRQILLDNMVHDGVAGYHVLTPAHIEGHALLLVNRGWVPAGLDRRALPDVAIDAEPRRIRGRLERLPRPGLRLGGGAPVAAAAPVVVLSYPTAAELAAALGTPVLDYQLLLNPEEIDGYQRDWRAPGLAPERHLVYAGQWLLLAAGALGAALTIGVRTLRRPAAAAHGT
jgi:surfeit locus 1 family protein